MCAERAVAVVDEFERELAPFIWAPVVAIMAARGDWNQAERYASEASEHALDCEDHVANLALARDALAAERSHTQDVADALAALLTIQPRDAVDEPGFWSWQDLYAHALIDLDRLEEADAFLRPHEGRAAHAIVRRRSPSWHERADAWPPRVASQTRRRRVRAGARRHQTLPYALRTGAHRAVLRRVPAPARQRRAASAKLSAARERFERLGVRPALERCERELRACGLRPAKRSDPDRRRLTPQELIVARLAASGMTNREIASEPMLSVRTVEYHLGHVYTKLGLRSRGQLARHLSERE